MEKASLIGKTLHSAYKDGDEIVLVVDTNVCRIRSVGDCCAYTYFTDLECCKLPAEITKIEEKEGETTEDECDDVRETEFVTIETTRGRVDFTLHVEHNGYYGGWWEIHDLGQPVCLECPEQLYFDTNWWFCKGCGGSFDSSVVDTDKNK